MGTTVKISPSGQVRIPKGIMEKLNIESGDFLEFDLRGGELLVKPKKLIDADQAWFWTKKWQEAEMKAEEDIGKGRVSKVFGSAEEGISHLRKRRKALRKAGGG